MSKSEINSRTKYSKSEVIKKNGDCKRELCTSSSYSSEKYMLQKIKKENMVHGNPLIKKYADCKRENTLMISASHSSWSNLIA